MVDVFFIFLFQQNVINPRFNCFQSATVIGWTVCAACTWYPWISQYTKSSMFYEYDVNDAARYNAFYPIVWGMFSVSLILMTPENRGGTMLYF